MVTLPDGVDACDIGTITVWCQPFRAIFTRLAIPRDVFVSRGGRVRESEGEGEGKRERGGEGERERGGGGRERDYIYDFFLLLSRSVMAATPALWL
jgi:hypothetical protein